MHKSGRTAEAGIPIERPKTFPLIARYQHTPKI